MYTYDEIIASGYYVFREDLTTDIICKVLNIMSSFGIKFDCHQASIKELKRIIEFNPSSHKYSLKDGSRLEDITGFIKEDLVIVFQKIQEYVNIKKETLEKQYTKKFN